VRHELRITTEQTFSDREMVIEVNREVSAGLNGRDSAMAKAENYNDLVVD